MLFRLALLFTAVPIIELALLIEIGRRLGTWYALGLVLITGIVGGFAAKHQGFRVFAEIRRELAAGNLPKDQLWDGLFILIGGILLITPGLLTDITGFFLLIPQTRQIVKEIVLRTIHKWLKTGIIQIL